MSHVALIVIARKRPTPLMMTSALMALDRTFKTSRFLISNAKSNNTLRRNLETLIMSKQLKHIATRAKLNPSRLKKTFRLNLASTTRRSGLKTS